MKYNIKHHICFGALAGGACNVRYISYFKNNQHGLTELQFCY